MNISRSIHFNSSSASESSKSETEKFLCTEWLVTNGLGGYSSSSISGITTRKYHGLLVAALPPPYGRSIMLNHLSEQIILPTGQRYFLSCEERSNGEIQLDGMQYLKEFRLELGLPIWLYDVDGILIEKRILFVHMQNTIHISYRLLSPHTNIRLGLRPAIHFRLHESPVNAAIEEPYTLTVVNHQYEISNSLYPPLRLCIAEKSEKFTVENRILNNIFFRWEFNRGYEFAGDLWSPGYLKVNLENNVTFIASTENWSAIHTLTPQDVIKAEYKRRSRTYFSCRSIYYTTFTSRRRSYAC
jgi:predicted glycogen debranching enzyme